MERAHGFTRARSGRTVVWGLLLSGVFLHESSGAQIIDRMLAIVDGRVITSSDVDRYRDRAELFGDAVPESRSALLEEVIEDRLIQEEIDQFGQVRIGQDLVEEFIADLNLGPKVELDVVRRMVRTRLERINYFDARFRRFVVATDQEIAAYYETVFLPAARARGLDPAPGLDEIRDLIEGNVITEKTDRQIQTWTDSLVRRSDVEIVAYVE